MDDDTPPAKVGTQLRAEQSLEKTAEQAMLDGLRAQEQVEDNPFMDLSMDELVKLANDMNIDVSEDIDEDTVKEASAEDSEELEKIAFDMLGGQIMAHSMVHEFGLMKEAMMQGLCRVCKTVAMDVEGSTVCSACLEG